MRTLSAIGAIFANTFAPARRPSPRAVLKVQSDRGRRKAALRVATTLRIMLEQQAERTARVAGMRLEEDEARACFKNLPTVAELAASAAALNKAAKTLR